MDRPKALSTAATKAAKEAEVRRQIADFLAQGKSIQKIPFGQSSKPTKPISKRAHEASAANRKPAD